jgi:class 3 adenylate cyclase/tetratricopeptide (TPR) repeat protein
LQALMPTSLAQKITAAAGEILGEQREVTVLYINVMHTTSVSHRLDNEDTYLLLDEALRLLVEVAYKYEGTIDKFTGDGLVVLFGAPVAHENDPERAVRTALEMQTTFQAWRTDVKQAHGFGFQMRLGINTGIVVAGKVGNDLHMEYTVVGETVNLAYHLQLTAEPDTLLVSAETFQRTRSLFEFKMLPALAIKWIPQPIQAFQLLAQRRSSEVLIDKTRFQAPMIGRGHYLARLQDALVRVQQEKRSQTALISGEAGIGKSRLVTEFCRTVELEGASVYQGNCLTYARQTPLWVVAQIVRDIIGLSESDSPETQREALTAYLTRQRMVQPEMLPYLTYVLGLPQEVAEHEERLRQLEPAVLQRQTYAALRQLFLAAAQPGPAVFIFEDLHWVDLASRDFLEYLIRTIDQTSLLLVLVARRIDGEPTLQPLAAAAGLTPARLTALKLQTLSATEGQLLADQLIPQTSTEARLLKQRIVTRAEGNPLFVEEIIRMLIDRGGLVRDTIEINWRVTPSANELLKTVPGNVKALMLARFDQLPEGLRRILQKAAVVGHAFPASLLQALLGTRIEALNVQLSELEQRQFIDATPFRSEPGYTFKHALLQETIYDTLLKRDRAKIHTQVAKIIENSSLWLAEEQAEMLAYHFAQGTNPAEAVPYLVIAGDNAGRRCAFETAIAHYRQAVSLLSEQPGDREKEFFEARLGLGRSLKLVGQFSEADQCFSEVLVALWRSDLGTNPALLKPILHESLRQMGDIRQREGDYDRAIDYLETGFQMLDKDSAAEEPELWQSLIDRMAWIRFRQGRLDEARNLALEAANEPNAAYQSDPIRMASLYNTLGGISWQQGRFDEAVGYVKQSLDLYDSLGYLWGTATAYGNLGVLYNSMGNWLSAAEYHERAQAVHQIIGNPQGQAVSFDNLGILKMYQGKHEEALHDLNRGLSIRKRLGDSWGIAQSHTNLAHLALIKSDLEEAAAQVQIALTMSEDIGSVEIQSFARWILAFIQAETNQLQAALQTINEALDMARSAGLLEREIECLRVLGVVQTRNKIFDEAEVSLRRSAELTITQNHPYLQGQALYELGRLYLQVYRENKSDSVAWRAKALENLGEAANVFDTLGATYDLALVRETTNQVQA